MKNNNKYLLGYIRNILYSCKEKIGKTVLIYNYTLYYMININKDTIINNKYNNIISINNTVGNLVNPGGEFDANHYPKDLTVLLVDESFFENLGICTHYMNVHYKAFGYTFVRTIIFRFSLN